MTTPVSASGWLFFFPMSFKMHANLGGKADPSELPILLIKSRAALFFYVPGIQELEVFFFFFYSLWNCYDTCLWVLLLIWQLGLLVSVATSGNPVALTALMVEFFSSPVRAGGVPALTALSLIKNSITTVHSLVSESVCVAGEANWCMLC